MSPGSPEANSSASPHDCCVEGSCLGKVVVEHRKSLVGRGSNTEGMRKEGRKMRGCLETKVNRCQGTWEQGVNRKDGVGM